VWRRCGCRHQAPADLQKLIEARHDDVPLINLRFRCSYCGSRRTGWVFTSRYGERPVEAFRIDPSRLTDMGISVRALRRGPRLRRVAPFKIVGLRAVSLAISSSWPDKQSAYLSLAFPPGPSSGREFAGPDRRRTTSARLTLAIAPKFPAIRVRNLLTRQAHPSPALPPWMERRSPSRGKD
jgi:hypothetical protein